MEATAKSVKMPRIASEQAYDAILTRNPPTVRPDEVPIEMNLDVPDELFRRPRISGTIRIDPGSVPSMEIRPEVVLDAKEVLEKYLGLKVDLQIVGPEAAPAPAPKEGPEFGEVTP